MDLDSEIPFAGLCEACGEPKPPGLDHSRCCGEECYKRWAQKNRDKTSLYYGPFLTAADIAKIHVGSNKAAKSE